MKENILDILIYLFENYIDEETLLVNDQEFLKLQLVNAGFPSPEVSKAFTWLEGLAEQPEVISSHSQAMNSTRVYLPQECDKLDLECRGFLLFLESIGILNATSRELIIDRAIALETDDFGLPQLKWVILMVLFNQPGYEMTFTWVEDLVYEELNRQLH